MKAFLFPGQGSQQLNMGKEIIESNKEYEKYLNIANEVLGYDLKGIIFGVDLEKLTLTENAQPALLTIGYIYYHHLIEKMEIIPEVVAGHSLGEWTALVAAGVVKFEDAVKLVHLRGKYMSQACPPGQGTMAAILGMKPEKIEEILKDIEDVVIANYNSNVQTVISGKTENVLKAMEILKENGAKKTIRLNVSGPFHSPLIKQAQDKLKEEIEKIEFSKPKYPIVQNVTAKFETDPKIIKENIISQITSSVKWLDSVIEMAENDVDKFYEAGPGNVLTGLVKRIVKGVQVNTI